MLVIDDDMKVHHQDLVNLYQVWKHHKFQIVGFSPRWVKEDVHARESNDLSYLPYSEDPPYKNGSPDLTSPHREGYSIMLTKTMMIHRDYLRLYTCGGKGIVDGRVEVSEKFESMGLRIIEFVDKNFNCEDIGMNFVVNAALGVTGGPAPLYVDSLHMIGDFGKQPGLGLHLRQSHTKARDACLREFNREFATVIGYNLPRQTSAVRVEKDESDEMHSVLSLTPYSGHRIRRHVDCHELSTEDACSWDLPASMNFTATYRRGDSTI